MHRVSMTAAALAVGLMFGGVALAQQDENGQGGQGQAGQSQGGAAGGQQHEHRGAVRTACADDFKTYCAGATDRDSRHQCIEQNRAKFSQSCQDAMASMHQDHGDRHHPPGQ